MEKNNIFTQMLTEGNLPPDYESYEAFMDELKSRSPEEEHDIAEAHLREILF